MVKLDPATLPAPLTAPATIQASDPIQSFEAILAEGGGAEGQPPPRTMEFGELGMLGRHAAMVAPELTSDLLGVAILAAEGSVVARRAVLPVEARAPAAGAAGAGQDRDPGPAIPGGTVRPGPALRIEGNLLQDQSRPLVVSHPFGEPTWSSAVDRLATPAARPPRWVAADNARQAQPTARIDIAGPGNGLQIAMVAPALAEDGRDRLRRLLAEIAADLGLHLAEFSLNGRTIASPGVGALGGSYGRISG
jgi:hypothetical protein